MAKIDVEELPWDIKKLKLSLGGIDDELGFIEVEVFNDDRFSIRDASSDNVEECKWSFDDINIEAARRLRDFLIYAVR
jgi:hypothetical protein